MWQVSPPTEACEPVLNLPCGRGPRRPLSQVATDMSEAKGFEKKREASSDSLCQIRMADFCPMIGFAKNMNSR